MRRTSIRLSAILPILVALTAPMYGAHAQSTKTPAPQPAPSTDTATPAIIGTNPVPINWPPSAMARP